MAQERGSEKNKDAKGKMTVEEAGHKGGQRVRELVEEGKQEEGGGKKDAGAAKKEGGGSSHGGKTSH